VELDPKYAVAYATLGHVTAEKTLNALSTDVAADRRAAIDTVARAEQLAPRDPVVLRAAGCVYAYTGSYRHSLELIRRAVKLAPRPRHLGYLGWHSSRRAKRTSRSFMRSSTGARDVLAHHPGCAHWLPISR
jgi:hypothetical protein